MTSEQRLVTQQVPATKPYFALGKGSESIKPPLFITFEGGEGSGKSTQIRSFYNFFTTIYGPAVSTREPGGVEVSERIRELLLDRELKLNPYTDLLLFNAARVEFIHNKVKPALDEGISVLCDRFADSTMAYQGYGSGLPRPKIKQLNDLVLRDLTPDLTFVIDVNTEVGLKNATKRGELSRFDAMDLDYHKRVNAGFREIAKQNPERCVLINYEDGIERVQDQIRREFLSRLDL